MDQLKVDLCQLFGTFDISEEAVGTAIDVNFIGPVEGVEIDFTDLEDVLESIRKGLFGIVSDADANRDSVVENIQAGGTSLSRLCVILAVGMDSGTDKDSDKAAVALICARIYLQLCCVNSSRSFGLVRSALIDRALGAYRLAYTVRLLLDGGDCGPRRKKNQPQQQHDAGAGGPMEGSLTADDFSKAMVASLTDLYVFLDSSDFTNTPNHFKSILDILRLFARFDYCQTTRVFPVHDVRELRTIKALSDSCFALAHLALAEKHNRKDVVLSRFCLPRLICKAFNDSFMPGNLPTAVTQNASVMLRFIRSAFGDAPVHDLLLVKRLAENVCHRCLAERIDYRTTSVSVIVELVKMLPQEMLRQFIFFVVNFGLTALQRNRLVAVDIVAVLFNEFDIESLPRGLSVMSTVDYELGSIFEALEFEDKRVVDANPSFKQHWKHFLEFNGDPEFDARHAMLQLLVRATMDKTSAVRGRALVAILPFIHSRETYREITKHAQEFLSDARLKVIKILQTVNEHDERAEERVAAGIATPVPDSQSSQPATASQTPVPSQVHQAAAREASFLTRLSAAPFVDMIMQRCNDRSAITRKFAIPVVEALLSAEPNPTYKNALVHKLIDFCRDPSVVVRKLAAEVMTNVLRDEEVYMHAWLHSVLPMVNDREEVVEKACRKMFFDKVVLPIIANDGSDSLSWNLLIEMSRTTEFMRAFRRCFQQTARDKDYNIILRRLANVLYGAVKVERVAAQAWMLLDFLAEAINIDPTPAIHAWFASDEATGGVDPSVRIVVDPFELVSLLSILVKCKAQIKPRDLQQLCDNIGNRLLRLQLPETVITDAVITLVRLVAPEKDESSEIITKLFTDLIDRFFDELTAPETGCAMAERKQRICRRLITAGQCALHAPSAVQPAMIALLMHVLSNEAPTLEDPTEELATQRAFSRACSRAETTTSTQSRFSRLQGLQFSELTEDVTASAAIAFGKFLLANENLARVYLHKLAVIHGTSIHAGVRNNVTYLLADCYLRYTSQMDVIQPAFLHSLRDRVDFVRYHALLLTTELLRSQYMKISPLVLARLLPLLLDPVDHIRNALESETLAVIEDQFSTVYIDNFVTCMFLFNRVGYGAYTDLEKYEMPDNPINFLNHDFHGPGQHKNRVLLYQFMLKKFDDQKRFMLINQISRTVFGNIVDGKVNFDLPETKQLVLDSFAVIELPEAKLTLEQGGTGNEDDDIPSDEVVQLARATIKATFCMAFVQHIMPQFMALSRFLALRKSPLQKNFRNCLAVIAESYPEQLHILFKDNAQLQVEVETELRRRKRDARRSRMARNRALVEDVENAVIEKENVTPTATPNQTPQRSPLQLKSSPPDPVVGDGGMRGVIEHTQEITIHGIGGSESEDTDMPVDELAPAPEGYEQPAAASEDEAAGSKADEQRVHSSEGGSATSDVHEQPASGAPSGSEDNDRPVASSKDDPTGSEGDGGPTTAPNATEDDDVFTTNSEPAQTTPKRMRLSLRRLQVLRRDDVVLPSSPSLAAPIPRLSERVGRLSTASSSTARAPLHSTPQSGASGHFNFPDISRIGIPAFNLSPTTARKGHKRSK